MTDRPAPVHAMTADEVRAEVLAALGEQGLDALLRLCADRGWYCGTEYDPHAKLHSATVWHEYGGDSSTSEGVYPVLRDRNGANRFAPLLGGYGRESVEWAANVAIAEALRWEREEMQG
jgi:hypothetical protein